MFICLISKTISLVPRLQQRRGGPESLRLGGTSLQVTPPLLACLWAQAQKDFSPRSPGRDELQLEVLLLEDAVEGGATWDPPNGLQLATAILGEFREEGQLQRRGRSQRGLEVRPGMDPTSASS